MHMRNSWKSDVKNPAIVRRMCSGLLETCVRVMDLAPGAAELKRHNKERQRGPNTPRH